MQLVTDITHFQSPEHTVLTIGTFDGIHIGHQRIITQVVERAKEQGLLPTVLTFFPHPRMVLDPSAPIALLSWSFSLSASNLPHSLLRIMYESS